MHEEVLTPIIWGDKAVALILAEPLNRSLGHTLSPPFLFLGLYRNKKAALLFRAALPSKQNPAFQYPTSIPREGRSPTHRESVHKDPGIKSVGYQKPTSNTLC